MKVLAIASVVGAVGVGIAIPLVLGDDRGLERPEPTSAQVEHWVRANLRIHAPPSSRQPDLVRCRRTSEARFRCSVSYLGDSEGEALFSGYDLDVLAHNPPTELERAFLRVLLSQEP